MCGIFGITGKNVFLDENLLRMTLGTLGKRGPDDCGSASFAHCILGHTRLSIIGLSDGHQPMRDNERNLSITFNGEIYNYKELRAELEQKGHRFSTHSDTEVILKAYAEYGENCPDRLDGMFAFAIWDEDRQMLFLARDRFGKKPLYYATGTGNEFLFASEIKALFASGRLMGEIDPAALGQYLRFMYVPPSITIFKNVHTLPPASSALLKDGRLEIRRYWRLANAPLAIPYGDAKEETKRLLTEAVRKRLVADVEVGALLSGGVDSTLVTALASAKSTAPVKTFVLGYGDHINELPYAAKAARRFGTDHHTLQATGSFTSDLAEVMAYFDEPHADSSDFPQHLISKLAASKVKVALSGDGADELFMGYGWYWKSANLSWKKDFLDKLLHRPYAQYLRSIEIFPKAERKRFLIHEATTADPGESIPTDMPDIERINRFDLEVYLPGQLLTKVDRMGMMHSLEVRSPFLDKDLAEFVFSLPNEFKTDMRDGKLIVKDILSEFMPKEFVYRRKQGFGAPVRQWLREGFGDLAKQTLSDPNATIFGYVREDAVRSLLNDFYERGKDDGYYQIWVFLCLELWLASHATHISS